ncbi:MAG: nucleotidyltransferase domain-containing protein [Chitinispirillales bacterium]|nr:nucleotidyltransferase domain-containing protein [Chitinispirillales bacterium]
MFGLPQDSLSKIKEVLSNQKKIESAIIYGSRAKGDYREGSDIDLSLKGDLSYRNLVEISVELDNLNLPWEIDLSLYGQIQNKELREHIDRVGVALEEKTGGNNR